jgi:hypothetical protein
MEEVVKTGSCLCSAETFEVHGTLRPSIACHCTQNNGYYWSATQVPNDCLKITRDTGLKWFRSSPTAQRGFCAECGSSLFWKLDGEASTSVGSGTLDGATGLQNAKHIFVADKGDYYRLDDSLPQKGQY